jgi:hypothetical protein
MGYEMWCYEKKKKKMTNEKRLKSIRYIFVIILRQEVYYK